MKGKDTEVSGITSGNNGNSSPNLCSQFGKNSRHEREDVPKKSNLFLHIRSREATRTFTWGYTYVYVNPCFRPCAERTCSFRKTYVPLKKRQGPF